MKRRVKTGLHSEKLARIGAPAATRTRDPRLRSSPEGGNWGQRETAAPNRFRLLRSPEATRERREPPPIVCRLSVGIGRRDARAARHDGLRVYERTLIDLPTDRGGMHPGPVNYRGRDHSAGRQADRPSTKRARSSRSISYGVMHLTPTPMQALGILIFLMDGVATSWVTTVNPCASAWATR